ncbi:MAG: helix-turn-helix domain-containing protein [Planctomycetota bacterium]|jgi:hypothetical protein
MPREPTFTTDAIRELFAELRYASVEARLRQMDRAERLVREVNPAGVYPEDFVSFRVTGYRPERDEPPAMLVGDALRTDLVLLVQRLSRGLGLRPDHAGRQALTLEEVGERLRVSARTLQRYRRQGLVCHYVTGPGGVVRLRCFRDALAAFVASSRERVRRAGDFSRLTVADREQLVDRAAELRAREGLTLNAAAQRLACEIDRAAETVRAMLRRHDRRSERPIFDERGPLTERDLELILRAWHFGVAPSRLARRFDKATTTIHHAVNRMRRRRLLELPLRWVELPTFELPDCDAVILGSRAAREGLEDPLGEDLLALAGDPGPVEIPGDLEDALIAAYNLLKRRARRRAEALPADPPAVALDEIETDLRWAGMVKRRLVGLALAAALRVVEQNLHRRLTQEPAEVVQRLVRLALDVCAATIETLDPARQELGRAVAFAMDRSLARADTRPPGRAAARHEPGSLRLSRAAKRFCPWQAWLDPRPDLQDHLHVLEPPIRALICRRYGWAGQAPATLASLAEGGGRAGSVAASLRAAERRLRIAARGAATAP